MARALLWARAMTQPARNRAKTWATVALFAVGAHGGVMAHRLLDPAVPRCVEGPAPVVDDRADVLGHDGVWCPERARGGRFVDECFVDLAMLEAQPMAFPRGLRLVPGGGGLRLDGARGLATSLGLRNGDVLLAIDDQPLIDGTDLMALPAAVARGGFTLHFRRAEHRHARRITLVGGSPA